VHRLHWLGASIAWLTCVQRRAAVPLNCPLISTAARGARLVPALAVILVAWLRYGPTILWRDRTVFGGKRARQAMGLNVFTLFVGFVSGALASESSSRSLSPFCEHRTDSLPLGASLDRNSRRVGRLDPEVPKVPTLNQKVWSTALGEQCDAAALNLRLYEQETASRELEEIGFR
jgi:hypothetical protein